MFPSDLMILPALWHHVQRSINQMWTQCHVIYGHSYDVHPATERDVDILSHDFWTHLWWPTSFRQWTFLHMIFGQICDDQATVKRNVDNLTHDFWTHWWWSAGCSRDNLMRVLIFLVVFFTNYIGTFYLVLMLYLFSYLALVYIVYN